MMIDSEMMRYRVDLLTRVVNTDEARVIGERCDGLLEGAGVLMEEADASREELLVCLMGASQAITELLECAEGHDVAPELLGSVEGLTDDLRGAIEEILRH